ncbi:MAG: response regulator transcription factor [Phycisphaerae bacterium]|nr:response regulator transcription factor [Phycisphaerae bacterium]
MMTKKRVFVVDDHPVVRQGLVRMLQCESDLECAGEADTVEDALRGLTASPPDLAVVDLMLKESNGMDLIRQIRQQWPTMPVLVMSMHSDSFYVERVLRMGVKGYLCKEEASDQILFAVRRVLGGEIYLSDSMSTRLIGKLVVDQRRPSLSSIERLTDREMEIFQMIGRGQVTRIIADKLGLSVKTVETHRANIKGKLNIRTTTELLQRAVQWMQYARTDSSESVAVT